MDMQKEHIPGHLVQHIGEKGLASREAVIREEKGAMGPSLLRGLQ